MNYERVNVWTNTLYALIQSVHIAKQVRFGNFDYLAENINEAGAWVNPDCSYSSTLLAFPFGGAKVTFRRDPNSHFDQISKQIIKMLIQDLVVIADEMMTECLDARKENCNGYPQQKIKRLTKYLDPKYMWSKDGCLELVAVRNVLTHANGKWNAQSISVISSFVSPLPAVNDELIVGFGMLFRYRKALRTFLNEVDI